ncbi:Hypothetical protein FKW44_006057 [Caligus rogercresseyi]|uniref:Uncharacterized protein n=1 Tax=Caligus rogercresseyi TaxID=217165 RepID=A0A7T8KCU2_CALRO|nr:Hypothetical protein FKW44_006057 [Caligus rogercresseyi]
MGKGTTILRATNMPTSSQKKARNQAPSGCAYIRQPDKEVPKEHILVNVESPMAGHGFL